MMRTPLSRLCHAAIGTALAVPVVVLSLVMCRPDDQTVTPGEPSVPAEPETGTLRLTCGDSLCLSAPDSTVELSSLFTGGDGVSAPVASSWSMSDLDIVSVTPIEDGRRAIVRALRCGRTVLTARYGAHSDSATVYVGPLSVAFAFTDTLVLKVGQTSQVRAVVTPPQASGFSWIWAIESDVPLASLTSDAGTATLTAVGEGEGTVIARAGAATARRPLRVLPASSGTPGGPELERILLDRKEITLSVGQSDTIRAVPVPSGASVDDWTWTCLGTGAVRLTSEGDRAVVSALREGDETVTVRAGKVSASLPVSVRAAGGTPVQPDSIAVEPSAITLTKGERYGLSLKVWPEGSPTEVSEVIWTVGDPSVVLAESNSQGVELVGVSDGSTTVRASYRGREATAAVTVVTSLRALGLYPLSLTLYEGQTAPLRAESQPAGMAIPSGAWTSDDPSVVSVEGDGKDGATVSALKTGHTCVRVSAGGLYASASVTVHTPLRSVSLQTGTLDMTTGQTLRLSPVLSPEGARVERTSWDSTNPAVVFVKEDGTLEALTEGKATVTCRVKSREEHEASVEIKVTPPAEELDLSFSMTDSFEEQEPSVALAFGKTPGSSALTLSVTVDGSDVPVTQPDWAAGGNQSLTLPAQGAGTHLAVVTARDAYGRTLQTCSLPFTVWVLPSVRFIMKPDMMKAYQYGTSDAVCIEAGKETCVTMSIRRSELDSYEVLQGYSSYHTMSVNGNGWFRITASRRGSDSSVDIRLKKGTATIVRSYPVIVFEKIAVQPYFSRSGFRRDSFRLGLYIGRCPVYMKYSVSVSWHVNAWLKDGKNVNWTSSPKSCSGYMKTDTDIQWTIEDILEEAESKLSALGRELSDVATLYITAQCEWTMDNQYMLVGYEESSDSSLGIVVRGEGAVTNADESLMLYESSNR